MLKNKPIKRNISSLTIKCRCICFIDKISHLFGEEKFLLDAFSLYIDAEEEIVKKMKRWNSLYKPWKYFLLKTFQFSATTWCGKLIVTTILYLVLDQDYIIKHIYLTLQHLIKFYLQSRDLLLLQLGTYSDPVDPEQIKDPVAAFILLIRLRSEWMSIEKYTSRSLSECEILFVF